GHNIRDELGADDVETLRGGARRDHEDERLVAVVAGEGPHPHQDLVGVRWRVGVEARRFGSDESTPHGDSVHVDRPPYRDERMLLGECRTTDGDVSHLVLPLQPNQSSYR